MFVVMLQIYSTGPILNSTNTTNDLHDQRKVRMSKQTHTYSNDTGFIRVDGDDIIAGQIDIQTARAILDGTQSTFDYLLKKEDSSLAKIKNINYPITTREGCWELLVPFGAYVAGAASGAFTTGLNAYAKTTGTKLAEKQFTQKENRELFESAFKKLEVVIKISQHLGVIDRKTPLDIKLVDYKSKKILLKNQHGNVLSITTDELDIFRECPEKLLRSLASVVTDYRTVSIGYMKDGKIHESVIDRDTKEIFAPEDDPQIPVLPELLNGEYRTLRGYVSRGNQITNTIGFQYNGHVVTCEPNDKLISGYLNAHYKTCEITGLIVRTSNAEVALGKRDRPKIIFDNLTVIEDVPMHQQSALKI